MEEALRLRIEKRAYEIYLERGATQGNHEDDWVRAEREIRAEVAKKQGVKVEKSAPVLPETKKMQAAPVPVAVAKKAAPAAAIHSGKKYKR